jgi:hypothetical protein
MKDWFPFLFAVVLMCSIVTGLVLFFQSLEVDAFEYQLIGAIYKTYPEMRPTIDEFMSDGYISWHESAWVGYELNRVKFNHVKKSVTEK